ncbi:MAG: hypothetical protein HQL69_22985 [Magnetococcales bacterium]|nr:hypothetical protein [Magnetococcales bacterium]
MSSPAHSTHRNEVRQFGKQFPPVVGKAIRNGVDGLRISGNQLVGRCPCHDDDNPSLSIGIGEDGKVLIKCHAGCETKKILAHLGLRMADLYGNQKVEIVYDYHSVDGELLFQIVRTKPKGFFVRRPDPGEEGAWINNIKGIQKELFRLDKILGAIKRKKPIFIVEGEKDVLTLVGLKLYATTNPFGAGPSKWSQHYTESLRGARWVMILPDNDDPGREHAITIATALHDAGIKVKIIELPDLPEGGDVTDWVADGGTRRELTGFCEAAPRWKPTQSTTVAPLADPDADKPVTVKELSPADQMIPVFNKRFGVVMISGKYLIIEMDYFDPGTGFKRIQFYQPSGLEKLFANQLVDASSHEEKQMVNPIKYWQEHPDRLTFNGLVFMPRGSVPDGYYNTWRGYAVLPQKGSIQRFLRHVYNVIADGDEEVYHYIIAFLADAVQLSEKKPGVVLVLLGEQGTGKGIFALYLGRIFGRHFMQVTKGSRFTGNFNSHLMEIALLFLDEAIWAGDKGSEGTFKAMITEPTLVIEKKHMDAFTVKSYLRIIMASNNDWAAPAGLEERRVFAVRVSNRRKGDYAYFDGLAHEMENGGTEALLDYLLDYDLSDIDLRDFPRTEALRDQKLHSMSPVEKFWLSRLEDCCLLDGRGWGDGSVPTKLFFDAYAEYFTGQGQRWIGSSQTFGTQLKNLVGVQKRRIGGTNHYVFPSLNECRKSWEQRTQQDWEWQDNSDEEDIDL